MGTGEELERLFLHWLIRMEGMGAVTVKRIGAFAVSLFVPLLKALFQGMSTFIL